jgi:hypothetical protein
MLPGTISLFALDLLKSRGASNVAQEMRQLSFAPL